MTIRAFYDLWLCGVLKEPGADTTPWPDALTWDGGGDEGPRRWTPEMLPEEVERWYGDDRQLHSRASILQRVLTHDAYHCGEPSQTLGIEGLPQIDLWRPD